MQSSVCNVLENFPLSFPLALHQFMNFCYIKFCVFGGKLAANRELWEIETTAKFEITQLRAPVITWLCIEIFMDERVNFHHILSLIGMNLGFWSSHNSLSAGNLPPNAQILI